MDLLKGEFSNSITASVGLLTAVAGSAMAISGKSNPAFSFLVALTVENKSTTNVSSCLQDCDFDSDFISQFFITLTEAW